MYETLQKLNQLTLEEIQGFREFSDIDDLTSLQGSERAAIQKEIDVFEILLREHSAIMPAEYDILRAAENLTIALFSLKITHSELFIDYPSLLEKIDKLSMASPLGVYAATAGELWQALTTIQNTSLIEYSLRYNLVNKMLNEATKFSDDQFSIFLTQLASVSSKHLADFLGRIKTTNPDMINKIFDFIQNLDASTYCKFLPVIDVFSADQKERFLTKLMQLSENHVNEVCNSLAKFDSGVLLKCYQIAGDERYRQIYRNLEDSNEIRKKLETVFQEKSLELVVESMKEGFSKCEKLYKSLESYNSQLLYNRTLKQDSFSRDLKLKSINLESIKLPDVFKEIIKNLSDLRTPLEISKVNSILQLIENNRHVISNWYENVTKVMPQVEVAIKYLEPMAKNPRQTWETKGAKQAQTVLMEIHKNWVNLPMVFNDLEQQLKERYNQNYATASDEKKLTENIFSNLAVSFSKQVHVQRGQFSAIRTQPEIDFRDFLLTIRDTLSDKLASTNHRKLKSTEALRYALEKIGDLLKNDDKNLGQQINYFESEILKPLLKNRKEYYDPKSWFSKSKAKFSKNSFDSIVKQIEKKFQKFTPNLQRFENQSLNKYPTDRIASDGKNISMGDLHGNAQKFLWVLIKHGVLDITKTQYERLSQLYKIDQPTKNNIDEFNQMLKDTKIINRPELIRIIGDELADRGRNDYFTLKIIEKLGREGIPLEIMYSNHSRQFLNAYQQGQLKNPASSIETISEQSKSIKGLSGLLNREIVSEAEVTRIVECFYKPSLKIVSYSKPTDETKTSYFMHAPNDLARVGELATYYGVAASDNLLERIDGINCKFQEEFALSDNHSRARQPRGIIGRFGWARELNEVSDPGNGSHIICGHIGPQDELPKHIINLDADMLGKLEIDQLTEPEKAELKKDLTTYHAYTDLETPSPHQNPIIALYNKYSDHPEWVDRYIEELAEANPTGSNADPFSQTEIRNANIHLHIDPSIDLKAKYQNTEAPRPA